MSISIPTQLLELFGNLPKLKSIQVLGDLGPPFIESLRIPLLHSVDKPIPFRNLDEVCFSEQEEDDEVTYRPELLQDLRRNLMQRCEYGSPLRYLWVGWKEMPIEEVPPLREIVVDVAYGPYESTYHY